jgi:hypothetical protein
VNKYISAKVTTVVVMKRIKTPRHPNHVQHFDIAQEKTRTLALDAGAKNPLGKGVGE